MIDMIRLTPMVNMAAAATSRAYPQVSFPDVAGCLWLWAVANDSRIQEYFAKEDGDRIVGSILRMEARTYALKERAVSAGYSTEDLEWYSPGQIRAVLPDVFDYENWQTSGASSNDRKTTVLANATGDRLASILDVKSALEKMNHVQYSLLKEVYGEGSSVEAAAEKLGISTETCRKRLDRAVYVIRDKLGGPRPTDPYEAVNGQFDTRTSGRRVVSNATARARTDHAWDGE
jgi:hypothetical protein